MLRFVDPVTGELSPVPDPAPESEIFEGTWIATFSPDGQYLLQAVGIDGSSRDFWATNLTTGEPTEVASDIEGAVPIDHGLTSGVGIGWHGFRGLERHRRALLPDRGGGNGTGCAAGRGNAGERNGRARAGTTRSPTA